MITRFRISNFKSLVDFELPPRPSQLGAFTCLIGLNGAGKSTLLQAFDFIAHVATGQVQPWLDHRDWKKNELLSNLGKRSPVIGFTVSLQNRSGASIEWTARFNTSQLRCTAETIMVGTDPVLVVDEGHLKIARVASSDFQEFDEVPFEYQGSVLSALKLSDARPEIAELKEALQGLQSLELLSPQLMRRKARTARDIGPSGEKLSPFLDQLGYENKYKLLDALREFYPQLQTWGVKGYRAGWKSLRIYERFAKHSAVEASHINDGFLRVIAILSQQFTAHQLILLDEIENGINPALVEKLMDFLVGLGRLHGKQVIVTTHSPVILNFLEDQVAKDGVVLLYKNSEGHTQACRYFDQPETGYKLRALGPGEVFMDTDLLKLVSRLSGESSPVASSAEAT